MSKSLMKNNNPLGIEYKLHKPKIRLSAPPALKISDIEKEKNVLNHEEHRDNLMPTLNVNQDMNTFTLQHLANAHQAFLFNQHLAYQHYLHLQTKMAQEYSSCLNAPIEEWVLKETQKENQEKTHKDQPMVFSRKDLEELSSGKISKHFGPLFIQQDHFMRQVRMPEPPLLLADRVTKIVGEAGSLGLGSIYTETDVKEDAWYLHAGHMPAGLTVEAGQADLLLISWLGIDFYNQDKRIYRLLGSEVVYFGGLPKPGDTLCFDIHVDGYANQGDIRLFFFHYDCKINGKIRLQVRHGQAGFFTDEELANSQGVLWDAASNDYRENFRIDLPKQLTPFRSFTGNQLKAFAMGDLVTCFGPEFYLAQTHTRTPTIQNDRMLFLHEIHDFDYQGGPKGRGYMRAIQNIAPNDWFFDGHFKNDPCMPGTLMVEAGLQLAACYLAACGFTLNKDGWRFEPVSNEKYIVRCRGQVTPISKCVVYEIFIDALEAEPCPTLYFHLLGTVDGLKSFYTRMGLRLVPDWPLSTKNELLRNYSETKAVAAIDGFNFDYASLLAAAWGNPLAAFGKLRPDFDQTQRVIRLPGPPYHFMSRMLQINTSSNQGNSGASVVTEYDIKHDEWYFKANNHYSMPTCVLMEVNLQPCGWLSVFTAESGRGEGDFYFRNLEGTAKIYKVVTSEMTSLLTRATLTKLTRLGSTTLVGFRVMCESNLGEKIYEMETIFGFFPGSAFAAQPGLPVTTVTEEFLLRPSNMSIDLSEQPAAYFSEDLKLPTFDLLMLNRITGIWLKHLDLKEHQALNTSKINRESETAEKTILCQLRAEKEVSANDWYFKAHFFQDPVQPGSLGVEAMMQLLQFYMLHTKMFTGIENPVFLPMLDIELRWKYRGQVVPGNQLVTVLLEVIAQEKNEQGAYAIAEGTLWVDGKCIYQVENIGLKIISKLT